MCACGGSGPASGPVSLYAYQAYDTPAANIDVVVGAPDGSFVASARTGADGKVTVADVPAGGTLTLAWMDGASARLGTVYGVQPGDQLTIRTSGSDDVTFNRLAVDLPEFAGAQGYEIADGCRRSEPAAAGAQLLDVLEWCVTPARTVSAVAYARGATGERVAYATTGEVTVTAAATPPPQIAGTLSAWKTDFADVTVQVTSLPGAVDFDLSFRRGGMRAGFVEQENIVAGGVASYGAKVPPGFYDEVIVGQSLGAQGKGAIVSRALPAGNATVEVELGAVTLPAVDMVTVDGVGTSRPTLQWRVDGASSAEIAVGSLAWQGGSWTFVGPPDIRDARVPELPAALAAFAPHSVVAPVLVGVIDHSHLASYDEARQRLRETILMAEGERALAKGGTILFSAYVGRL